MAGFRPIFAANGVDGTSIMDAATTTQPDISVLAHTSSGIVAAGFGITEAVDLQSSTGIKRRAMTDVTKWTTATNGAEVASRTLSLMLAGTLTPMVLFNTGNGTALEILTSDGSTNASIVLSKNGVQGIAKTGSADFFLSSGINQLFYISAGGGIAFAAKNNGIQFFSAGQTVAQQVGPVLNVTNSVTVGGTNGTIADFTSLSVYATDAATIRNNIYQLARLTKMCSDALRAYGLLS